MDIYYYADKGWQLCAKSSVAHDTNLLFWRWCANYLSADVMKLLSKYQPVVLDLKPILFETTPERREQVVRQLHAMNPVQRKRLLYSYPRLINVLECAMCVHNAETKFIQDILLQQPWLHVPRPDFFQTFLDTLNRYGFTYSE